MHVAFDATEQGMCTEHYLNFRWSIRLSFQVLPKMLLLQWFMLQAIGITKNVFILRCFLFVFNQICIFCCSYGKFCFVVLLFQCTILAWS